MDFLIARIWDEKVRMCIRSHSSLPDTPFQSPLATILLDNKYRTAYSQNWSFTIERQIIRDTRVRVGYVGTKATHLDGDYDENAPIYDFNISYDDNLATINQRRPYQGYQSIAREFFGLNSSYNALQVSVDKRFSQGFTILSSYTWSKTLDYVSQNNYAGNLIENSFDFFFARGLSDQNRPQTFVNSFVWDLPSPGGANVAPVVRALTRDWKTQRHHFIVRRHAVFYSGQRRRSGEHRRE